MSDVVPFDSLAWLWCQQDTQTPNQVGCFRRTFPLEQLPDEALLRISADARYWLYVNGRRLGYGPARYPVDHPFIDQHDLRPFLNLGENTLAVRVHGIGKVKRCSSFMPVRCAMIAHLALRFGDQRQFIPPDHHWRALRSPAYAANTPRYSNHQGFVESFDAQLEPAGWTRPGFDDRTWPAAVELGRTADLLPWNSTRPRPIPFLTMQPRLPARVIESGRLIPAPGQSLQDINTLAATLAAARRVPLDPSLSLHWPMTLHHTGVSDAAYVLLDFAENSAGYVTLDLHGEPGTIVDLGYSENIRGNHLETHKQKVNYCDRVVLGDTPITYHPAWPKAMQYLLIAVRGRAVIESVRHDVSTYPLTTTGRFACDDMTLERIWQVGLNTVRMCAEDVFMDTPRRERAGWLADLRPQALIGYTAFSDASLVRHQLEMLLESQDYNGIHVDYTADPRGWVISRWPSIDAARMPDFTAMFPMIVLDYLRYTGDRAFVEQSWPRVTQLAEHLCTWIGDDGLVRFPGYKVNTNDYLQVDWAPVDRRGANSVLNMVVAGALDALATLAGELGHAEQAARFAQRKQNLGRRIQETLFDANRGMFANGFHEGRLLARAGFQENLLALLFDLATPAQRASIERVLLDGRDALPVLNVSPDVDYYPSIRDGILIPWDDAQPVAIGSPYFTFFAVWALLDTGRADLALNTLRRQYGPSLSGGASSTWEEWHGGTSQSHGWSAGPTWLLSRYVLGVSPDGSDGHLTVLPTFGDLTSASGRVATRHGTVQVEWSRHADQASMGVLLPAGVKATVGLPCPDPSAILRVNDRIVSATALTTRRGRYLTTILDSGDWTVTCTQP